MFTSSHTERMVSNAIFFVSYEPTFTLFELDHHIHAFICVNTEQGWEISVEMVEITKIRHRFDSELITMSILKVN